MKKIREARKFELYKKKVFIIDVCLALISTPLGGLVIRKNILARVSKSLPPTPTRGVVIRTEQRGTGQRRIRYINSLS